MRIGLGALTLVPIVSLVLVACSATPDPGPAPATTDTPPTTAPPGSPTASATAPTPPPPATPPPAPGTRPEGWGPAACPSAANKGFGVGESLADVPVRDCDTGAPATLADACGAKATWIFAAHTHCPTCRSTAGFTDQVAAAVADKGVAVVHLVYDDNGTSCAKWREAYKLAGIPNVYVYDDPGGAAFAKLKTSSYTAPSMFLNKDRVVTFKEHGLSQSAVLMQIEGALAQ